MVGLPRENRTFSAVSDTMHISTPIVCRRNRVFFREAACVSTTLRAKGTAKLWGAKGHDLHSAVVQDLRYVKWLLGAQGIDCQRHWVPRDTSGARRSKYPG